MPKKLRVRFPFIQQTLPADTAPFVLSGVPTGFTYNRYLRAQEGSFTFLGQTIPDKPLWISAPFGSFQPSTPIGTQVLLPELYATSVVVDPSSSVGTANTTTVASWLVIVNVSGSFYLKTTAAPPLGTLANIVLKAVNAVGTAISPAFSLTVAATTESPAPATTGTYSDMWDKGANAQFGQAYWNNNGQANYVLRGSYTDPEFGAGSNGMPIYFTDHKQPSQMTPSNSTIPDGWAKTVGVGGTLTVTPTDGVTIFTPIYGGFMGIVCDYYGQNFFIMPG